MTKTRKEFDSLGSVDVPADKLWAAQTERSVNNFKIGHPEVCQLKLFMRLLF